MIDPEYVEDIEDQPADPSTVMTDDELESAGLTPVRGWMRTRSSKNALRVRKAKAKAEAGGDDRPPRRQLNIAAPVDDDARAALKEASSSLLAGGISAEGLRAAVSDAEAAQIGKKVERLVAAGGWRAALLRRLLR